MEAKIKQDTEKLKKLKPSKVVHKKTFKLGSVICTSSVSGISEGVEILEMIYSSL